MRLSQHLRRNVNRLRRGFRAAPDPDPVVELDGAPPRAAHKPRPRRRGITPGRVLRFTLGFLGAGLALAISYIALAAHAARAPADWTLAAAPVAPDAHRGLAMAGELLTLSVDLDAYRGSLFVGPYDRRARIQAFQLGAAEAVGAYLAAVDERRVRSDPDIATASAGLREAPEDPAVRQEARAALARYDARRGRAERDEARSATLLADLSRAVQTRMLAQAAALAAAAQSGEPGFAPAAADAAFQRARGEAFAWRLLLSAQAATLPPDVDSSLNLPLGEALRRLETAADFHPLLVCNGPPDAVLTPRHLSVLAALSADSAASLASLAEAAAEAAPAR